MTAKEFFDQREVKITVLVLKILLTVAIVLAWPLVALFFMLMIALLGYSEWIAYVSILILPAIIPLLWTKKKARLICLAVFCCLVLVVGIPLGVQIGQDLYEDSITIDTTPNIVTSEYLPFVEDSKIVKLEDASLQLEGDLPIIDGATAAFPVYSAFVHAVYPETTELYDGVFEYNNTVGGYKMLAQKKTDIFIGAAPSKEQIAYAEKMGTVFDYTQIGYEAFVFFVHKDNPIDSLTSQQIKDIYSGKITNWKEVGGEDKPIEAFQRDEGSGSQSMMLRFMGDTTMIDPEIKEIKGMGAIIEEVADYRNLSGSIGFSFRFYIEGMIKNPDIKMIAVDGVAPTVENIKSGAYPIIAPVYAVTYEGNDNPNVQRLLDWILSDEGQYIIEKTGYVGN